MWASLRRSFRFAFDGLRHALRTQPTFRIHVAIAGFITALVIWLPLSNGEAAVMILAIAAVLAAELFNTAVEAVVDLLVERNHHQIARAAKDVAAAAVLITAVAAAAVFCWGAFGGWAELHPPTLPPGWPEADPWLVGAALLLASPGLLPRFSRERER
jgi:diacylglycerol kinase